MITTLRAQDKNSVVVVLALDEHTYRVLLELEDLGLHVINLWDIESQYPKLLDVKFSRSVMEYLFTLTPWITKFALDLFPDAEWVTYLDADLQFQSEIEPIFTEISKSSVGIVPHRFSKKQEWRLKFGTYNVAWVSFKNSDDGRTCLEWWAEQCLFWCNDAPLEDGRFADQGYLDEFEHVIETVRVIENPGVNLAPWNLTNHEISVGADSQILVDGSPLIFFHFHGLLKKNNRYFFKHAPYGVKTTSLIRENLYRPYCSLLESLAKTIPPQEHSYTPLTRKRTILRPLVGGRHFLIRWLAFSRGDWLEVDQ